jgi:hypothetical protein
VFSWNGPKGDNPDLYVQQIGVTAPPYRLTMTSQRLQPELVTRRAHDRISSSRA